MPEFPSRIVQIIPAEGWYATYLSEDNSGETKSYPLISFALLEINYADRRVEGILGSGSFARDLDNFLGYTRNPSGKIIDPL